MGTNIAQYVAEGDFIRAIEYARRRGTRMVTLKSILSDRGDDQTYIIGQIVKAKKGTWRRVARGIDGRKAQKVDSSYDRLFLIRDLTHGDLFYMKTPSNRDSVLLMRALDVTWIGETVLIYEPTYKSQDLMYDVPIIRSKAPFLPVITDIVSPHAAYLPEGSTEGKFYPIFGHVRDLCLRHAEIVYTCPAMACDGNHGEERNCVGLEGSGSAVMAISVNLSCVSLNVKDAEVVSRRLGKVFLDDHYFGPRLAVPVVDVDEVRAHIRFVLLAYEAAEIPWIVAGWFKTAVAGNDEVARARKFHISYVAPRVILPDIGRMAPPLDRPFDPVVVPALNQRGGVARNQNQNQHDEVSDAEE